MTADEQRVGEPMEVRARREEPDTLEPPDAVAEPDGGLDPEESAMRVEEEPAGLSDAPTPGYLQRGVSRTGW